MSDFSSVLIANRGEIAVRVIRACADAGLKSIAVYADADRLAQHVEMADEAYALGGATAKESYLDISKIIDVAHRARAEAIHPGYGFLAENADFARAVIDAGLVWIGPPPEAIEVLGNKVTARQLAVTAGAPLVPGTSDPVADADEVVRFAEAHGLPVAIKAAFGGGGRGLKVAHTLAEIPQLFDSATREAAAAFGRSECFVERFLERPRHVETQCLADQHGDVVVVSTRDCSLQRRHQKLVEEAPAPFLSATQVDELTAASTRIMRSAGYVGAGTCEFLIGIDGTISFLEVNTRLQVEHTITEEVTGVDLVQAQFEIAAGASIADLKPEVRGHSLEFRINGEDPALNFMPAPGKITKLNFPAGPGVRVDAGVRENDVVSGNFDSMIAKLIVTGATRAQAIQRARRAFRELEITGIPTVVPFHKRILQEPAFVANTADQFAIYTTWIESEFAAELAKLPSANVPSSGLADADEPAETERVVVEVAGKRLEVVLPAALAQAGRAQARMQKRQPRKAAGLIRASGNALTSPMQGTIVQVAVAEGQKVAAGELVVVLEAMKMEQPLTAHRDGVITGLKVTAGDSLSAGMIVCEITD